MLGAEKGGAASSSSPPALPFGCLAPWALPKHSGWTVLAHIAFFLIGSSNRDEGWGIASSTV